MTRTAILIAAGLAFATELPAVPAQAQALRTFVSATGSDSNNCVNVATPCRHFAAAFAATAADGEIYVLDPANYGSLTITHAVSIQGHGWGSVAPPASGAAVTINAGPTDAVNLSGLTIDGTGLTSTRGIVFNSGKVLTIENCVIRNVSGDGIALLPTTSSRIEVSNTHVTDNGGNGIFVQPPSGSNPVVNPVFNRVEVYNNAGRGIGLFGDLAVGATIRAMAIDSVVASNGTGGIFATGGIAGTSLFVFRSMTFRNGNSIGTGIRAESSAFINVSQSNLEEDGWSEGAGAFVQSYGDNYTASSPVPSGETIGKN